MTDNEYITMMQGDRLSREFPGRLSGDGDSLLGKLAVAAVLGILLAAAGGLTDASRDYAELPQIEQPWTGDPPKIVLDGREARSVASR